MPTLIGDIGNWVWRRLNRPDLQDKANENAGSFYLLMCGAVPFEELQITSAERAMISGTASYDISDLSLAGIAVVRLNTGSFTRRLRRSHVRVYDSIGVQSNGIPATYARWGKSLEFNPPPSSSSYTYRLRYWSLPELSTPVENTTLVTPITWDELMRYETLYRTYMDIEEFEKAAQLVSPMPMPRQPSPYKTRTFEYGVIPKLWNDLLKTLNQREHVDEDFGINPVVRRYTHV